LVSLESGEAAVRALALKLRGSWQALRLDRKLTLQRRGSWNNGVVPIAVEFVAGDVQGVEFLVGDFDAIGVRRWDRVGSAG